MSCAAEVHAVGYLVFLAALLSSLGWTDSILTNVWHLLPDSHNNQFATIINSALGCATQVFLT